MEHVTQTKVAMPNLSGLRVMVVDDSHTIRRSAEIFLTQAGCEVVLAENGFDALAKVSNERLDLVFVDVIMPRLDGYQFCSLVKRSARHKNTPVVMLSSKDSVFDRERGARAGSDAYVTKPFSKENLLLAVERQCPGQWASRHDAGPIREMVAA